MKTISVDELQEKLNNEDDFQFIDVREQGEYDQANLGGEFLPMSTITQNIDKISKDKDVVIMCRSGNRSGQVVMFLEEQGFKNLYNLEGGILAWKQEIDGSIDVD